MAIVSLRCITCDNDHCPICPCGTYIHPYSKRGCTRRISEEYLIYFQHYMSEVLPFIPMMSNPNRAIETSNEILDFLDKYIYSAPIGQVLDNRGKIKITDKSTPFPYM